jgi:PAS domain S-box-containing protein
MQTKQEPIRVLHVDDDHSFCELTATYLEREHDQLSVESATTARNGLNRLTEMSFDCVVSDYDMPGQNGIEFLDAVRDSHPDLPFILFTGKGSEEVAAEAIAAGATEYIQKSGDSSQYTVLVNRITNAVEKYRTQRKAERANRRRRRTLQQIADGFTELDSDLTFTDVNEQTLEFTGLSREELIGKHYCDLVRDDANEFIDAYREVIKTEEPRTVVAKSDVNPDRWIQERIFPAENGDGLFTYFRDVTDRKRREQEIEEQKQLYSTLVEQSPNGIMIVQDEEIVFANERMATLTGMSEDELLGCRFYEIMTPEYRDLVRKRYEKRIRGEQPPRNYKIEVQTDDGGAREIDLHVSRIPYQGDPATLATFNSRSDK